MRTQSFPGWLRIVTVIFLLLTSVGISPAHADGPVPGGIIDTGKDHTCALRPDGSIDCWGSNLFGQAADQPGPYTQVSVGLSYACALTPAGAVDCWGHNHVGQAEDQSGPYTQVSAGELYACALTPAGAADCWGLNSFGVADDQPGPYTQVSAGYAHTCALRPDGGVDCWGRNDNDKATDQPGPYTQVSVGYSHTCALKPDGNIDCWGSNDYGQAEDLIGRYYIQISAGYYHTCGLRIESLVDCWGWNGEGEATPQDFFLTEVSAGEVYTCALTPVSTVECWGSNGYGQAEDQPFGPYGPYQPSIDTTSPVVTVTGVAQGSSYILGAVPQAGCSTTDEGSGVAIEASLSLSGGNALGVGSFTATCSGAEDNAGNPGNTATVNYNVAFQFTGFNGPVDNAPVMNIARAGQTIPLKWRITDANGNPITNLTDVIVTTSDLACSSASSGDAIEEYATSSSGLQNLGDGYYQWNWKTPTSYANSCKALRLDIGGGPGSAHTALFLFK